MRDLGATACVHRQASKNVYSEGGACPSQFSGEILLLAAWSQLLNCYTREEPARSFLATVTPAGPMLRRADVASGHGLSAERWLGMVAAGVEGAAEREAYEVQPSHAGVDRLESVASIVSIANPAEAEAFARQWDAPLLVSFGSEPAAALAITYSSEKFSPEFVEILLACLAHLLEQLMSRPGLLVTDLSLTPPELQASCPQGARSFSEDAESSFVHGEIEDLSRQTPDAIAITFKSQQMSYGELAKGANRIASRLMDLGSQPETIVAVHLPRSLELLPAILGVLKAGAAFLPLDAYLPPARIGAIMQDSQASVVITSRGLAQRFEGSQAKLVILDCEDSFWEQESMAPPSGPLKPEHLAYVIYTSGSTGTPKGVMIEHRNLTGFLTALDEVAGTAPGVWLALASTSFDISIVELLWTLSRGFHVVLHEGDEGAPILSGPDSVASQIVQHGVTHLLATPTLMRMLASDSAGMEALGKLRVCMVGGEAFPPALATLLLQAVPGRIFNAYGPTEITVCATCHLIEHPAPTIPIGQPLANTSVYVVDRWNRLLPPIAPGELLIGGRGVGRGYLGKPQLTSERFLSNPFAQKEQRLYRTGDLVRISLNGSLEFIDRLDYQVKIRGYRVELGEIESALQKHPSVLQAVVVARTEASGEKVLVGYYTPENGMRIEPTELRAYLQATLPRYMTPSILRCLSSFPLNGNGKVDRQLLAKAEDAVRQLTHAPQGKKKTPATHSDANHSDATHSAVAGIEAVLCSWCGDLLKIPIVEPTDDFFELGGESLTAVQLMNRITRRYGAHIRLSALVKARTMRQVAGLVCQSNTRPAWAPVVSIRPEGSKRPLFLMAGIGGNVINFEFVSRALKNRPVYGVETQGLDRNANVLTSVEEMARVYLEEMRRIQSRGPYHLAGYSFGGVLAFERAHQLQAAGEQVGLLGLIDTLEWRYMRGVVGKLGFLQRMDVLYGGTLRELVRGPNRLVTLRQRLKATFEHRKLVLLRAAGRTAQAPDASVEHRNYYALTQYVARPYSGEMYLFRCQEKSRPRGSDPLLGWGKLATKIAVEQVPGDHEQLMSRPFAGALGTRLEAALAAVEHNGRSEHEIKQGAA